MKANKLIFSILAMFCLHLHAAPETNHGMGNGGGVICINGVCKTLVDSGLKMSPTYPNFWVPGNDVLNQINLRLNRFPFMPDITNNLRKNILLKLTHFRAVDVYDQAKLDEVKQLYKDTILATTPDFDFSQFTVAALSSDNTVAEPITLLFPSFFSMDASSQAQIIIHEGLYRGRPSSDLKYVLQLDSSINALNLAHFDLYANRNEAIVGQMIASQIAAFHLNILNKPYFFVHALWSNYCSRMDLYGKSYYEDNYCYQYNAASVSAPLSGSFILDFYKTTLPFRIDHTAGNESFSIDKDQVLSDVAMDYQLKVLLLNMPDQIPLEVNMQELYGSTMAYEFGKDVFRISHRYKFSHFNEIDFILPN